MIGELKSTNYYIFRQVITSRSESLPIYDIVPSAKQRKEERL